MRKQTKIWLITAASLVLIGCMIFGGTMTMLEWDFRKLSTVKYETNSYEIAESFKNISIKTDTSDIVFVPCEDAKTSVSLFEQKNIKHSVKVNNDTLEIEIEDTRRWYEYIGLSIGSPKITVYIPKGEYGALTVKLSTGDIEIPADYNFKSIDISASTGYVTNLASATEHIAIKTSTGNITVKDVSAKSLDLTVSTGRIMASDVVSEGDIKINVTTGKTAFDNVECRNLTSNGSTGAFLLKNVVASEKLSVKRSTGDIKFDDSDAAEILVKTDTGDVTGSLLSDKVFITHTDTGKIDVPNSVSGGKCEITTDTGDIRLVIK